MLKLMVFNLKPEAKYQVMYVLIEQYFFFEYKTVKKTYE